MLKLYLTTVVIWMIIIYATAILVTPKVKENGWFKYDTSEKKGFFKFCLTVLIPGVRLIVWVFLFVMCLYTPEQFEELIE